MQNYFKLKGLLPNICSAVMTLDVLNIALALFGPTFLPVNVGGLRSTES